MEMIVTTKESVIQRIEYWKKKLQTEFDRPMSERDNVCIGECRGHIDALWGIINIFSVDITAIQPITPTNKQ